MAAEDHVEIGGGPGPDAQAELHGGAALDDEQVATIVMADVVEHGAHHTDSHYFFAALA